MVLRMFGWWQWKREMSVDQYLDVSIDQRVGASNISTGQIQSSVVFTRIVIIFKISTKYGSLQILDKNRNHSRDLIDVMITLTFMKWTKDNYTKCFQLKCFYPTFALYIFGLEQDQIMTMTMMMKYDFEHSKQVFNQGF